ncbi:stage II sporulation protein E [Bacillus sp. FJAT-27916]|uniref:stage II sporulation protein E n=1 Tax=Bacillaceae TaxID=186817 RepID=UPI0006714391|nr:stage II sporulation protein E [Bacillus sp. FJAT-27916]KMY46149.1 stage II sporulation protein E [Bacillus sp. FJAT-27916]
MSKVENNQMLGSVTDVQYNPEKWNPVNLIGKYTAKVEDIFIRQGYILVVLGFLLGRALILSQLTPFSLPFFAAVYMMKRERSPLVMVSAIGGALTVSWTAGLSLFASCALFLLLYKLRQPSVENQFKLVGVYVLIALGISSATERYLKYMKFEIYDAMMVGVEAGLALILTLIFIQCIPLISVHKRPQSLKTEEVISLIIMLASVMTGTIGWAIYDVSLDHILSRYLVLLFAVSGGASIGSTVGVVTGLIFSLANLSSLFQMSLLAFSGLLGGLLKEGRKIGVSLGLIIATLLIGLYGEGSQNISITLYESLIAISLFLLTPASIIERVAKHIPGTVEHANEQQQYVRKVRDVTAQRVNQFSSVFLALSNSFSKMEAETTKEEDRERDMDYFLSNVTEKTCQTCFKKDYCWAKNFDYTYGMMSDLVQDLEEEPAQVSQQTAREWKKFCTRYDKVTEAMLQEISYFNANQKLKKQVKESRRLVADQLQGVSKVMEDFAKEITKERENLHIHEEQLMDSIRSFGLDIHQMEIYSLEQGNIDIDMQLSDNKGSEVGEKLIAPMLSDILGEHIIMHKEEKGPFQRGICRLTFRSAKRYAVVTGVAHAAKGGGLVSGDSYKMIDIGKGKYAIAISDGMGNGQRAHNESTETLQLLQTILESGIEEKVAIKSINSILSLRTTDEIFSTLDLAMIDLQDANIKFLKVGSTPSFIKRGQQVTKIQSNNLPIGIIKEFDVDVVNEQLKAGDLLVMMSDGIFEGPKHVENYEAWMNRKIREIKTEDPQEVADIILEEVIRTSSGRIEDDMTIVVAQIKHNIPKWSSIPMGMRRKKAQ